MAAYGEFTLTLEDVVRLTMLPMFGEANPVEVILEEEDRVKLNYLTSIMTAWRTTCKFSYATWLNFFDKGDYSKSGYVVEAFLSY